MNPLFILLFTISVLSSIPACKNKEVSHPTETNTVATVPAPATGCYLAVLSRDSIWLKLTIKDQLAEGELNYMFYEKDKSKGKLIGSLNGDTLIARYTFMSEGMESTREVAFLRRGSYWVEGYGEMDKETGTQFKNRQALDFNHQTILKPVACN